MKYWLFQNNQVVGPYTTEELSAAPGFSPDSLVCPEGRKGTQMGDWQKAGVVTELAGALRKPAPVLAAPEPSAAPAPAASAAPAETATLPPEPTLRDLAALGSLQEKVAMLESALARLQDDLKSRDVEVSSLKGELERRAQPSAEAEELRRRLAQLEGSQEGFKRELSALKSAPAPAFSAPPAAAFEPPAAAFEPPAPGLVEGPGPIALEPEPLGGPSAAFNPPAPSPAPLSEPPKLSPLPLSEPISLEPEPLQGSRDIPNTQIGSAPAMLGPTPFEPVSLDIPASAPPPGMGPQSLGSPLPTPLEPAPLFSAPVEAPKKADEGPVDLSFSGSAKTARRKGLGKLLLPLLMLGGLGAGAAYYLGYLDAFLGAKPPVVEAPAPEVPAQPPVDVQAGMPDRTQEAVDLVKSHPAADGRTLSAALEGPNPPVGLSPWMVEKTPEGRFQVNFYPQPKKGRKASKNPRYQFEADLDSRSVRGLNAASAALLAKPGASRPAGAGLLDDPLGQVGSPAPAPRRKRRAKKASGEPAAAEPKPRKSSSRAKPEKEASLDELLLPGVPKPEGGHAELERLLDQ